MSQRSAEACLHADAQASPECLDSHGRQLFSAERAASTHQGQLHLQRVVPSARMSVATSISYVTRPQAGFHLSAIQSGVSAATRRAPVLPDPRPVQVRDTRDCDTKPSLSRAGFELIKLKDLPSVSWTTPEQVSRQDSSVCTSQVYTYIGRFTCRSIRIHPGTPSWSFCTCRCGRSTI